MNIKPNNDGWRFDESVGWKLIHNDIDVIFFEETDKAISTQEKLFVGTHEECEAERVRLGLHWYPDVVIDPEYEFFIHDITD
jgi:hypothetical protein